MLDNKMIGNRIRDARKNTGLSQEQLAKEVFVQKQAVSQWETGKTRPSIDSFDQLKRVLGINILEFCDKTRKNEMEIKKLKSITDYAELILTVKNIAKSIETDSVYEKTVTTFLEYTLITVLGYECYYLNIEKKAQRDKFVIHV